MLTAVIKLAVIALRSLFVLLALYSLPVESTGAFGLALTLMGFYTFAVGYERYGDLQRRLVGAGPEQADRLIVTSLRFYLRNHLLALPVFLGLLAFWVGLPWPLVAAFAVIAVVEHASLEAYRITLIAPRYQHMLMVVVFKDALVLALAVAALLRDRSAFDFERMVLIWCACSALGLATMAVALVRNWSFPSLVEVTDAGLTALDQYRASATHFVIGLVALAALQIDRLVVGALLTLAEAGIYFRHVFLVSFLYQMFNVLSYNRLMPTVYAAVKEGRPSLARRELCREQRVTAALGVLLVAGVLGAYWVASSHRLNLRGLEPELLLALIFGYAVRAMADFRMMLLYASVRERLVVFSQCIALVIAGTFCFILGVAFGTIGIALGMILSSAVFLVLLEIHVRRAADLKSGH